MSWITASLIASPIASASSFASVIGTGIEIVGDEIDTPSRPAETFSFMVTSPLTVSMTVVNVAPSVGSTLKPLIS